MKPITPNDLPALVQDFADNPTPSAQHHLVVGNMNVRVKLYANGPVNPEPPVVKADSEPPARRNAKKPKTKKAE